VIGNRARLIVVSFSFTLAVSCGGREPDRKATAAGPAPVQVGRESTVTVGRGEIQTGPAISGQLAAAKEATVRAKVGGSLVNLPVEEGEPVKRGQVVARIEARDLRDAAESARVNARSAENALRLAQSEWQRTETLVKGGALAERDLDNARNAVATAEAQLAAARARLSTTEQQLGDTTVESPLTGVVSAKSANAGDVVQPGAPLVTVIDPSSMRLEASVPSERIGDVRIGSEVTFQVRGYPGQTFTGKIVRISPAADPATRQVPIFVSIPNTSGRLIAGLFAEGRVNSQAKHALVLPVGAIDMTGPSPAVTRVRNGKAERVTVELGLRDPETERVEILSGLNEGDMVLTGGSRGVTPGTPVQVTGA
jgi:membrane fusion protein (multidrug efflux system)